MRRGSTYTQFEELCLMLDEFVKLALEETAHSLVCSLISVWGCSLCTWVGLLLQ
jgi:hypothetical protein